jgi:ATP-dependent Clp protease adapter protein ClpS
MATQTSNDIEEILQEALKVPPQYKLFILNDDTHTMGQVVNQINKAVKCGHQIALAIMSHAHDHGKAVVMSGTKEECEKAQKILEEIQLGTILEQA